MNTSRLPLLLLAIGCGGLLITGGCNSASKRKWLTTFFDGVPPGGDVYVIKNISGRLMYLHVDKNTKRERMLVPGERIEADVIIGERVVALRPAK